MTEGPSLVWRLERHDAVGSTQDLARARLDEADAAGAGDPPTHDGLVVVAAEQRGGRGRRRRDWASPRGGLWLTALLDERRLGALAPPAWPAAVAFSLAGRLVLLGVAAMVKWPNDLLVEGRGGGKLAGVLVERHRGHALVGVGLNVVNEVPAGATSLARHARDTVPESALDAVLDALRDATALTPEGFASSWPRHDALAGATVRVTDGSTLLEGRALGVAPDGRLRLEVAGAERLVARGGVLRVADAEAVGSEAP